MAKTSRAAPELLEALGIRDLSALTPATRLFASFVIRNHVFVLSSSAAELSRRIGVSDATVIRAVRALGFDGLPHFKQALAAAMTKQAAGPAPDMRRTLAEAGEGARNGVMLALRMQREAAESLQEQPVQERLVEAVCRIHVAQRVAVYGIGPTAHLARYMTALLLRGGRSAFALDAAGIALADQLLGLQEGDLLLALAYGRTYREITATIEEARRLGLPIVMISDSVDAMLTAQADVLVPVKRGTSDRVAFHAATVAALEAITLGLASCDSSKAIGSLGRLDDLRRSVLGS